MADAFDVKVQPVVESRTKVDKTRWRTAMRYTVTNALPKAVTVKIVQGGLWGDSRIVGESLKSERQDADNVAWSVPVPANGKVEVAATIESRY